MADLSNAAEPQFQPLGLAGQHDVFLVGPSWWPPAVRGERDVISRSTVGLELFAIFEN